MSNTYQDENGDTQFGSRAVNQPSRKSPEIEKLIDAFNPAGRKRVDSIMNNICSWCGCDAILFRDSLSVKEYTISGFCQKCQDETFGKG